MRDRENGGKERERTGAEREKERERERERERGAEKIGDVWVLRYVSHYKEVQGSRPQDGYFSSIYIYIYIYIYIHMHVCMYVCVEYSLNHS